MEVDTKTTSDCEEINNSGLSKLWINDSLSIVAEELKKDIEQISGELYDESNVVDASKQNSNRFV